MRFEQVLPALRGGKKIRRKIYNDFVLTMENIKKYDNYNLINQNDVLAEDWEIVDESECTCDTEITRYRIRSMCPVHGKKEEKVFKEFDPQKNECKHDKLIRQSNHIYCDDCKAFIGIIELGEPQTLIKKIHPTINKEAFDHDIITYLYAHLKYLGEKLNELIERENRRNK